MEENIVIDKSTLKALVVDTRLNILKLLSEKKKTLSDISELLNLKKSTVKEHLDILVKSNLIKKEKTNRKWKFYSLTYKGKLVVKPKEVKIMFAFFVFLLAAVGSFFTFFKKVTLIPKQELLFQAAKASDTFARTAGAIPEALPSVPVQDQVVNAVNTVQTTQIIQTSNLFNLNLSPYFYLGLFILLIILAAFLFGLYLRKETIIINSKGEQK